MVNAASFQLAGNDSVVQALLTKLRTFADHTQSTSVPRQEVIGSNPIVCSIHTPPFIPMGSAQT